MRFLAIPLLVAMAFAQEGNNPPPSSNESSSRGTLIDLSPPTGDERHPGSDVDDESDVVEMHPYDPHKAAKDLEVGDFYLKQKNYKAAISRYRSALEYKANDAEATMRLAGVLEKVGELPEAAELYRAYLKVHPNGEFAPKALAASERLKAYAPQDQFLVAMSAGEVALQGREYAAAEESFQKALGMDPKSGPAKFRLAESVEGQRRWNDALRSYYEYLQSNPGGSFAEQATLAMTRLKKKGATLTSAPASENRP